MKTRRDFIKTTATSAAALWIAEQEESQSDAAEPPTELIVDTHQHLWDLKKLKLPWLTDAPPILRQAYHLAEYKEATQGLAVRSIYMEVDVDVTQLEEEAAHVSDICRDGRHMMVGAVIGGRPESADFQKYVSKVQTPAVKGVRRVLHVPETPAGYCLQDSFVRNVQWLGTRLLSFDLCMRPNDLPDGIKLAEKCPETRFILDHCGNADAKSFNSQRKSEGPTDHDASQWKRDMETFARCPNVICKISGIIARLWPGGDAADLAPIVNHCLDAFGPDRVVFGSDWPVCLLGRPLTVWVTMLRDIVRARPAADQQKLWSGNAIRQYRLSL